MKVFHKIWYKAQTLWYNLVNSVTYEKTDFGMLWSVRRRNIKKTISYFVFWCWKWIKISYTYFIALVKEIYKRVYESNAETCKRIGHFPYNHYRIIDKKVEKLKKGQKEYDKIVVERVVQVCKECIRCYSKLNNWKTVNTLDYEGYSFVFESYKEALKKDNFVVIKDWFERIK